MSEMSDTRRDDLERDTGNLGDVRDLRDTDRDGPGAQTALSTDQIANPGSAQPTASADTASGADTTDGMDDMDSGSSQSTQLLDPGDREAMTQRWRDIQADFVDQPQKAMKDADALVAGLMQQLAQMFSHERSQLEAQWSRGDQVSTEELRVSLQRYRAFFERLLSA